MATDFKYASQSDLEMYYPAYSQFDVKRVVYGWELGFTDAYDSTIDIYYANNTGLVTNLFWDGAKLPKLKLVDSDTSNRTTLGGSMDEDAVTMTVGSSTGLATGDIIKVNDEYMIITSIDSGTVIGVNAVSRGMFGTTAVKHVIGSGVKLIVDVTESIQDSSSASDGATFFYDALLDLCVIFVDTKNPADYLIEAGVDSTTYFDQMLVNASMELNNLLDRRYPTPIPKYTQYDANTTHSSSTTEYDAILIKATSYICASNLLRTNNRQEDADYYHQLVTNTDGTGLVDKLNKGEAKLSYEVDADDSKGKVRNITKTGTMDIIETAGYYTGELFDLLRITCTTAGAYGVAKVKVEYYGNDKLLGSEDTDNIVTGRLETYGGLGGLYVRFQGAAMAENDQWEIEVYSEHRKITNAESGGIQLTRRGYGI